MKLYHSTLPSPVRIWRRTHTQRRTPWYLGCVAAAMLLGGCSTAPPQPPLPKGEFVQANRQAQALAELLEIARAATPKRYRAERAVSVRTTLQGWAETAGLELHWRSLLDPSTSGIVDEFDLRRALMAMAHQFRDSEAALIVDLSNPKAVVVTQAQSLAGDENAVCSPLPAGAIALGRHCIAPLLAWSIDPSDAWLSETLHRWAGLARLELVWATEMDWPIKLNEPRRYGGDILRALHSLQSDLRAYGVHLHYTLSATTLSLSFTPPAVSDSTAAQTDSSLVPTSDVNVAPKPPVNQTGIKP